MTLLATSADQSGIMQQMDGQNQSGANLGDVDESIIEHQGKKYQKIQIDGLGEDEEYLMDENGDIYSLDFKFITNMGDNVVITE